MALEELQRMIELVSGEDPQLRRYAITQIEYLAESEDAEEVMDALRNAVNDPVPFVSHQANRTLSAILARGMQGEEPVEDDAEGITSFGDVPIEELRKVGGRVLWPLVERLKRVAGGGNANLAKRAIIALGKTQESSSFTLLEEILFNPELSKVCAIALTRISRERAVSPLIRGAQGPDTVIRSHCILELGRFPEVEATDAVIANGTNEDPSVRANVALALGTVPDRARALAPLIRLLSDEHIFVVLDAIRSLGRFSLPDAVRACVSRYRGTDDVHIKAAILVTLGATGSAEAQPVLLSALQEEDDRVRANAIEALQRLPLDKASMPAALEPLLADPNNRVRANAAIALASVDADRSLGALKTMVTSEDLWFRASGAYALGVIEHPRALELLAALLVSESEPEVLIPAMKSLDRMKAPPQKQPLLKLLEHSAVAIRTRASRLIGRSRDTGLFEPLREKFDRENDSSVRATLISTLGRVAETRHLPFIARVLERDSHTRVQANAIEILAERGGLNYLSYIRPHVGSSDNRVKANSVMALFNMGEFQVANTLLQMFDPEDPRQMNSAIFAAGEMGRTLAALNRPSTPQTLLHSLKNRYLTTSAMTTRPPSSLPDVDPDEGDSLEEALQKALHGILVGEITDGEAHLEKIRAIQPRTRIPDYVKVRQMKLDPGSDYEDILVSVAEEIGDFLGPVIELANLRNQKKDVPGMVEGYLRAYDRRVEQVREQLELVRRLHGSQRDSEAIYVLKDLLGALPLHAEQHHRLGRLYLHLKQYELASRHLFLAHVDAPDSAEVTYDYACACYARGRAGMAMSLCDVVIRSSSGEGPVVTKARRMYNALRDRKQKKGTT